jgi:sarcosine oxidase, subunit alpha
MSKKINLTIDGRRVEADDRSMLIDVLNHTGIRVPQLCHHQSLTPSGACRLCIVEVTRDDWNGKSKIVTSCLYPVEEGLKVSTRTAEVLKTRRNLLELYLAQCPGSKELIDLARQEGIDETSFTISEGDNNCVMCGLCTRVCQDLGPGAISTLSRGVDKFVGPGLDNIAAACTGCRACAAICPTGAIPVDQQDQVLTIWNRQFEIPICSVNADLCRGCGICEEVCPFSIPRVSLKKGNLTCAVIAPADCVGCGICAGSCPTGAISQKMTEDLADQKNNVLSKEIENKNLLFACSRSPLPSSKAELIRVSCIGSVEVSTMLSAVAAGADRVALMCRDRYTCPYKTGGDLGEKKLAVAGDILNLCGLDKGRIALLDPYPGQEGPDRKWQEFKESTPGAPVCLKGNYKDPDRFGNGMDQALSAIRQLKEQPELQAALPEEIEALFESPAGQDYDLLYLDNLPELHLLLTLSMDEPVVLNILKQTAEILKDKNIKVRPVFTEKELAAAGGRRVITLTSSPPQSIRPGTPVISLDKLAGTGEGGVETEAFTFVIDAVKRRSMLSKLNDDKAISAMPSVAERLQYELLLRPGAWKHSLASPPEQRLPPETNPSGVQDDTDSENRRIDNHPILPFPQAKKNKFTFNDAEISALEGEVITSALYAAGITVFGHHARDGAAQGIYCVNGQCSQCMVIADGKPVKGCMTPVTAGMVVKSVEGLPELAELAPAGAAVIPATEEVETDVLIIGGGPAGISAAIELGSVGVDVLLIDDKQELGGKLSLQTHNFFGSVADCYAGSRGVHIGHTLADNLNALPSVKKWFNSTVVGVYRDGKFGVSGNGTYKLVKPRRVLFSTGAREKSLALPGADLPGVYGAGAFQTLVNRDLIRCAERLFIVGGGNVGLIGAYHALQAGIDVVGLVEALPQCGGYKVHEDKIKRFGVPVWTSHTVLRIEGREMVERVIIAAVDDSFRPIEGTERSFEVDTVLIAVGLSPVDELLKKAEEYGIETYAAGDAEEIAEASAAIFSGKIVGRRIAQGMGIDLPVPSDWEAFGDILKHHAGESDPFIPEDRTEAVFPLIRCMQEIPCNPCTEACPKGCISMPGSILALPEFSRECIGCGQCVLACPGLAINLVINDYDPDNEKALLMMPYEFVNSIIPLGREVNTTDMEGNVVGRGKVIAFKDRQSQNSRRLLLLEVPYEDRLTVAGFQIRDIDEGTVLQGEPDEAADPIVCRCERVRKSTIVRAVRDGVRDMNQLKAVVRTGLGGCNGKTCTDLILRIFKEEGIPSDEITMPTHRPLVAEVHLGDFIAKETGEIK